MDRKQELITELNEIRAKEIESQLLQSEENLSNAVSINELKDAESDRKLQEIKLQAEINQKNKDWWSHFMVVTGDFLIKILISVAIAASFIYIVYQGSMVESTKYSYESSKDTYFSLLSVVGPLMGVILQYFFGSKKSSVNGE